MSIELVVFDLAGTTVKDNQDVHKVLQKALSQIGSQAATSAAAAT